MTHPNTGTRSDYADIADTETTIIECACKHCETFAATQNIPFPMRAEIGTRKATAVAATKTGVHTQVKAAYQPLFGKYADAQRQFGPWKA